MKIGFLQSHPWGKTFSYKAYPDTILPDYRVSIRKSDGWRAIGFEVLRGFAQFTISKPSWKTGGLLICDNSVLVVELCLFSQSMYASFNYGARVGLVNKGAVSC